MDGVIEFFTRDRHGLRADAGAAFDILSKLALFVAFPPICLASYGFARATQDRCDT